jgi:7-cyano-7-deazaguanine reductase
MQPNETKVLGKHINYKENFDSSIIQALNRNKITSQKTLGDDIWNAYDFMFIQNKTTKAGILTIIVPSQSSKIIESKSMKLYLNSFYIVTFNSKNDMIKKIKKDLEKALEISIKITFSEKSTFNTNNNEFKSLHNIQSNKSIKTKKNITYKLAFDTFRSLCPVTGQPDFATIYIQLLGTHINKFEIRKKLEHFQNKQDFHETCIEDIYETIQKTYNPKKLAVLGCFNRRGGIDINPSRYSHKSFKISYSRQYRQ